MKSWVAAGGPRRARERKARRPEFGPPRRGGGSANDSEGGVVLLAVRHGHTIGKNLKVVRLVDLADWGRAGIPAMQCSAVGMSVCSGDKCRSERRIKAAAPQGI